MGSGFFPAPGTDYSRGDEPTLARQLGKLARSLHLHLIGLSGYRTPAHSVRVGGFADDPHTQAKASDTPGVERVPERTLNRFGLTRPFGGAAEADHIQLFGGSTRGRTKHHVFSIADLWIQAGGQKNLAPVMAAIAMAESGGRVDAVGGPNNDGTYDYGLFQINSSHSQFDANRLVSDAAYNAKAAVTIWRAQGLGAWSTYKSGAYKQYIGNKAANAAPTFGRTRPGGGTGGGDSTDAASDSFFADYISQGESAGITAGQVGSNSDVVYNIPGTPLVLPWDPTKIFTDPGKIVKDGKSFVHFVAWIFSPVNLLRAVEFVTGFTLMVMGIHTMMEVHKGAEETTVGRGTRRAAGNAFAATPVGRSVRVAKGARAGKQAATAAARRTEFETARKKARTKSQRQARVKVNQREMDKKYGGKPPF